MRKFKTLATRGVFSKAEIFELPGAPSEERLKKGPVAIIECAQEIACNPCETACPQGAIKIGEDITSLPVLDGEECEGCGSCIPACPGLAIFMVDLTFSEKEALVDLPHEFLPLPSEDEIVECLDREGKPITKGKVISVDNLRANDRTPVISVAIPKEFVHDVRAIKVKEG